MHQYSTGHLAWWEAQAVNSLYCAAIRQGNPGSDGPPGRDGATGVKVKNTKSKTPFISSLTQFKIFVIHLPDFSGVLRVIAVTPVPLVLPVPQVPLVQTAQLVPPANRETGENL